MACICEKCGKPSECDWKLCIQCFIDDCKTDTEKNMYAGGRFYGEKLEKESEG